MKRGRTQPKQFTTCLVRVFIAAMRKQMLLVERLIKMIKPIRSVSLSAGLNILQYMSLNATAEMHKKKTPGALACTNRKRIQPVTAMKRQDAANGESSGIAKSIVSPPAVRVKSKDNQ